MSRRTIAILAVAAAVVLASVGRAGTAPNRLDANLGAVLSSPRIHNLYWDADWNSRSAHDGFHRAIINAASGAIPASGYFGPAGQYGVGRPSFAGSNSASPVCGPTRAPKTISAATVQIWVTCMVTTLVTGVPPPIPRAPISNDLYVVYLPARTKIVDNLSIPRFSVLGHSFGPLTLFIKRSCSDYGAYHAFSVAVTGLFPYAVVPTRCFKDDPDPLDGITVAASHEIVEAATDPILLAGRIDNSVTMTNFKRLLAGEAADICSGSGAAPTAPVRRLGIAPGTNIPVNALVAPYWSNSAGACVTSNAG